MADLKEDKIDFVKLEKELEKAIQADAKYWRENDAKLRAVDQRVESYEQFRDMVAAAHLHPLEKTDKISESKLQQPWNPLSAPKKDGLMLEAEERLSAGSLPTNGLEFNRDWKRCQERFLFLKTIGTEKLGKILKKEIGIGILGEILLALNKSVNTKEDADFMIEMLKCLPNCGRFSLAVDFLSIKEQQATRELFETLEDMFEAEESPGKRKQFKDEVQELRKLYQIT